MAEADLEIVYRDPKKLKPYGRNARTHSPDQVLQIRKAIDTYTFTNPILLREDGSSIGAGHGRWEAALLDPPLERVPTIIIPGLTEEQWQAYIIADNKLALNSGWDEALLRQELGELRGLGFDLNLTGFDSFELGALFKDQTPRSRPDDVPAAAEQLVTQKGDIWVLGDHRIICGDSTDQDTFSALMGDEFADCVFTSPPYALGIDYGDYQDTIENLRTLLAASARAWMPWVLDGGFAVVNFSDICGAKKFLGTAESCEFPMALEHWPAFRGAGWLLWSRRVWCKPTQRVNINVASGSNRAVNDWEHVWTWRKPGKPIIGFMKFESMKGWIDTSEGHGVDVGQEVHGAGMAVELPLKSIPVHCRPKKIVIEPFCGTGTTLISTHMLGRRCFAVELNPKFVDISVRRWMDFAGQEAFLTDGRPWTEVATDRAQVDEAV